MTVNTPPGWLQNAGSTHTAQQMRVYLGSLLTGRFTGSDVSRPLGGVNPNLGGRLFVAQNGSPNMSVNVSAGVAYIPGTESTLQGTYFFHNDATVNLSIATAPGPGLNRIDLVVAKVEDTFYSGSNNLASLAVVTGSAAASPSAPSAPNNSIVLAQVFVGANVTSIVTANITDTRFYAAGLGGAILCTSTTHPNTTFILNGQLTYESDTGIVFVWDANNSIFRALNGPAEVDTSVATAGTTTSTSYTATLTGAGACGVSFTAPASGKVRVDWGGQISNGAGTGLVGISFELRTGNVVGSGTVIQAAADATAAFLVGTSVNTRMFGYDNVPGLTANTSYNVQTMQRVSAGTGTFQQRTITVAPVLL